MLKAIGCTGVENLKPFDIAYWPFAGGELMVSRTGFTGDLGYELWIDTDRALPLWDALFDKGANHGIRPMGTHALEIARIEAGFMQAHVDFLPADQAIHLDRSRSPFELDLGRLVDFKKPELQRPPGVARGAEARLALPLRAPRDRGQQAARSRRTSTTASARSRRHGDLGRVVAVREDQHRAGLAAHALGPAGR